MEQHLDSVPTDKLACPNLLQSLNWFNAFCVMFSNAAPAERQPASMHMFKYGEAVKGQISC